MIRLPVTAVLLGAGRRRFYVYGNYAIKNKKKLKIVAVAEPIKNRRENFAKLHYIPSERCFESWENLLSKKKLADVAFIFTRDQMHTEHTLLALEKGYHVLLENPMANRLTDCIKIVQKVEEPGRILEVSHVLRYADFFNYLQ